MLSLIVPVYNVDKYLHELLDSIVVQTCRDFEAILIDDGSTDASGRICDEYARKYPFFRVYHQANAGVSVARNRGMENAKGEFVAFIDADDVIKPNYVETLLSKVGDADVVFFSAVSFNCQTGYRRLMSVPDFCSDDKAAVENYLLTYVKPTVFGYTWSKLFRMSVLRDNGLTFVPGLNYKEDDLFISQFMQYAFRVRGVKDLIYQYRTGVNMSLSDKGRFLCAQVYYDYYMLAKNYIDIYMSDDLKMYEYSRFADILHKALYRHSSYRLFQSILTELRILQTKASPATVQTIPQKLRKLLTLPAFIGVPLAELYVFVNTIRLKYKV